MADPRILASMRKLLDTAGAAGQARPSFGPPGGGSQSPAPEIRCWTFGRGRNSPEPSEGPRGGCPLPRNSSADRGSCKRGPWRRPGFISDAPGRILGPSAVSKGMRFGDFKPALLGGPQNRYHQNGGTGSPPPRNGTTNMVVPTCRFMVGSMSFSSASRLHFCTEYRARPKT